MPRFAVAILVLLLLLAGGIYLLSTLPKEVPAQTIEVDVQQGGNAS